MALNRVLTSQHLLKNFIANRVSEVQDIIQLFWFHVPTAGNPADRSSRVFFTITTTCSSDMAESTWLSDDPSNWPSQDYPRIRTNEIPETKLSSPIVSTVVFELAPDENYLERFSSLTRIKHIFGLCLRFKKDVRKLLKHA